MPPHTPARLPRLARAAAAVAVAALAVTGLTAPAQAANKLTPRNFTGHGFDQCLAPTQAAMDAWLTSSPYWAVGIYISGKSRACRNQPNLTPEWVSTQLQNGWRLLPITLGPQASCNPRFPRYNDDVTIDPNARKNYKVARMMGRDEALSTVADAQALGISPGSTLWYDMEGFDLGNTACRESAMWFLSTWTKTLHRQDYVSGVYSSAGSGIKALDDLRVDKPTGFALPDRIWIARWDGVANTSTSYIRPDGWLPGNRMKQYRGGHNETYGGVTINIDSNWLDLGKGSTPAPEPKRCGGIRVDFARYKTLRAGDKGAQVKALQCLLSRQGYYQGTIDGLVGSSTIEAVRALRRDRGMRDGQAANRKVWASLHTFGITRLVKYGAASETVRRLQRALNAAATEKLAITGVFEDTTTAAVKRYQSRRGLAETGVVTSSLWSLLQSGKL